MERLNETKATLVDQANEARAELGIQDIVNYELQIRTGVRDAETYL